MSEAASTDRRFLCQLFGLVFFTVTPPLRSTLLFANLEFIHFWLSVPKGGKQDDGHVSEKSVCPLSKLGHSSHFSEY